MILALHALLFNVGFKLAWLFLTTTAWHSFSRLGTTLNQREEGTRGIFKQVQQFFRTFSWKYSESQQFLWMTAFHWLTLQINGMVFIWQRPPSWNSQIVSHKQHVICFNWWSFVRLNLTVLTKGIWIFDSGPAAVY